jgi:hypothetical protein
VDDAVLCHAVLPWLVLRFAELLLPAVRCWVSRKMCSSGNKTLATFKVSCSWLFSLFGGWGGGMLNNCNVHT